MRSEFFSWSKGDRRSILSLLVVAAIAVTIIVLAGGKEKAESPTPLAHPADSTPRNAPHGHSNEPAPPYYQGEAQAERFPFDPNTADSTQLLRLGLQSWQVRNIYKYRAAGGIYRKKEDFARLYGLTVKQYRELEPYIHISADYLPAATLFNGERQPTEQPTDSIGQPVPRYPVKLAEGETIDLALADTSALQRVPGIGPYYARRIISYGQQLGGYVSLEQLTEIENFPQEALEYLTLSPASPQKLNVNTLSVNQLKQHPYINFYMARAIVDYRRQQGAISDLNDLRLLPDFSAEVIERLRPYVTY